MFQFTSFSGRIDEKVNKRPGLYVFRISGQNYQMIISLLPFDGGVPKFAQLSIYDTEHKATNRVQFLSSSRRQAEIGEAIVDELIIMFNETNIIVKAFRIVRDRFG